MATLISVEGNRVLWCDSEGLHSSHAVSLKTVKVSYTITQQDVKRNWAVVPVRWHTPFEDKDYNCTWGIEDVGALPNLDFSVGDIHAKNSAGFDAVFYLDAPGQGAIGETVYINAIGFHE